MDKNDHMQDISQKVLNTIADGKVKPRPKWHFFLQEGGVWVLGAAATLCGAAAISGTLFVFVTAPLRFYPATHESLIRFWADFLPLLWIVLFVTFIFVTDYVIKKTKRGYRYNIVVVTVTSAALSMLIGYVGFLLGMGEFLENRVGQSIPFHTPVRVATQRAFHQPEQGLLVGEVLLGERATLRTLDGIVWDLDLTHIPENERILFTGTETVGIIGTTTADGVFAVCMVLPINAPVSSPDSSVERKPDQLRTSTCKGVRPYERLQTKLMMSYENQ